MKMNESWYLFDGAELGLAVGEVTAISFFAEMTYFPKKHTLRPTEAVGGFVFEIWDEAHGWVTIFERTKLRNIRLYLQILINS